MKGESKLSDSVAGGKKAAAVNMTKDPDFYRKIGAIGGKNGNTGGFASNPKLAKLAGARGGHLSKRGKDPKRTMRAKRAQALYKEGWTIEQLTNEFNVTKSTIFAYLKEGE